MLPKKYRFQVENNTGATLDINGGVTITALRYKFVNGVLTYESSEAAIYSNAATIADGAFDESSEVDNNSDAYLGGHFVSNVVATGGSPDGAVAIYLQATTDDGTTWQTDGEGIRMTTHNFTAVGTGIRFFEVG